MADVCPLHSGLQSNKVCTGTEVVHATMVSAINMWAESLVRYMAGIVKRRKEELAAIDRRTRKLMTIGLYNSRVLS